MPWSGSCFISAPMRFFRSWIGETVISPIADRPPRIAFQMSGAVLPSAQMPPMPVTAIRWRVMSGVFLGNETANRLDHVADVLEIAPRLDRVHLDLDAVGFLQVEDDLGQFQRMDAQGGKLGVQTNLAGIRFGMSLDLGNDVFSDL